MAQKRAAASPKRSPFPITASPNAHAAHPAGACGPGPYAPRRPPAGRDKPVGRRRDGELATLDQVDQPFRCQIARHDDAGERKEIFRTAAQRMTYAASGKIADFLRKPSCHRRGVAVRIGKAFHCAAEPVLEGMLAVRHLAARAGTV